MYSIKRLKKLNNLKPIGCHFLLFRIWSNFTDPLGSDEFYQPLISQRIEVIVNHLVAFINESNYLGLNAINLMCYQLTRSVTVAHSNSRNPSLSSFFCSYCWMQQIAVSAGIRSYSPIYLDDPFYLRCFSSLLYIYLLM